MSSNYWRAPLPTAVDFIARQAYEAGAQERVNEHVRLSAETDAQRRHEARVVAVQQAIRTAMASSPGLFNDDADVPKMAEAAVRIYEATFGQ